MSVGKLLFINLSLLCCSLALALDKVYFSMYLDTRSVDNTDINVFYVIQRISLQDCISDCKSRKRCQFINYIVRSHTCFLLGANGGVAVSTDYILSKVSIKSGCFFGIRKEWFAEDSDVCETCPDYGECLPNINANSISASACKSSGCKVPLQDGTMLYGTQHLPGKTVKFSCRAGYKLIISSTNTAVCGNNGEWSSTNFTCLYDCGTLSIDNGQFISSSGTLLGMSATVACNIGYELSGESLITCTATGWDGNVTCRHKYEVTQTLSWAAAKSYCESRGGHLIDVSTAEKQVILVDILKSNGDFISWTGGNDIATEGEFQWSDNTLVISGFTNYGNRQPDDTTETENCLEVIPQWNYQWNDARCTSGKKGVCEYGEYILP